MDDVQRSATPRKKFATIPGGKLRLRRRGTIVILKLMLIGSKLITQKKKQRHWASEQKLTFARVTH